MNNHNYQKSFAFTDELIVDNFAGGGGASLGIEMALGRPVDIAINHDEKAIEMHSHNHAQTHHYCESVWEVDPRKAVGDNQVKLAWFSPDCKHFSKAKGGKPVEKSIRGLAWVAIRWAATVKPKVIMLENVEEFVTWGPIVDGQPCKKRKGKTFNSFKNALKRLGYEVEYKMLRACDYGAPTIRKRLFMIARCDGQPIVWPAPTHGPEGSGLLPYKTAADIIDWSIPCPSIFERKRPLVENTLRRIAKGLEKFVFNTNSPFILNLTHGGRVESFDEPLRTITGANRGEKALITPYITRIGHTGFGGNGMQYKAETPLTTITSKAEHCLVTPILDRQFGNASGSSVEKPLGTVMPEGSGKTALVTAFLAKHFGGVTGVGVDTPFPTITGRGTQNQVVTAALSKAPVVNDHTNDVKAFLIKYYSTNIGLNLSEPLHTVSTKDRFGLVTVHGEEYQIVDIGMRMLSPRELYRAQGFPDWYDFDCVNKTQAVAKCGNSVSPLVAKALVEANLVEKKQRRQRAA